MTTYVTFGSGHNHIIKGVYFNYNCVAVINSTDPEQGRKLAFYYFGKKFCMEYFNHKPDMKWFPRGLIRVPETL